MGAAGVAALPADQLNAGDYAERLLHEKLARMQTDIRAAETALATTMRATERAQDDHDRLVKENDALRAESFQLTDKVASGRAALQAHKDQVLAALADRETAIHQQQQALEQQQTQLNKTTVANRTLLTKTQGIVTDAVRALVAAQEQSTALTANLITALQALVTPDAG